MKKLLIVLALLVPAHAFSGSSRVAMTMPAPNITGSLVFGGIAGYLTAKILTLNVPQQLLFTTGGAVLNKYNTQLAGKYKDAFRGAAVGGIAGTLFANLAEQNSLKCALHGALIGGLGFHAYFMDQKNTQLNEDLKNCNSRLTNIEKTMATKEQFETLEGNVTRVEGKVDGVVTTLGEHSETLGILDQRTKDIQVTQDQHTGLLIALQAGQNKIAGGNREIVTRLGVIAGTLGTMNDRLGSVATLEGQQQILAEQQKTNSFLQQLFQAQNQQQTTLSRSTSYSSLNDAASSDSGNDENRAVNFVPAKTSTPAQTPNRSLGDSWVTSFDCDGAKYSANITEVTSMFFNK